MNSAEQQYLSTRIKIWQNKRDEANKQGDDLGRVAASIAHKELQTVFNALNALARIPAADDQPQGFMKIVHKLLVEVRDECARYDKEHGEYVESKLEGRAVWRQLAKTFGVFGDVEADIKEVWKRHGVDATW